MICFSCLASLLPEDLDADDHARVLTSLESIFAYFEHLSANGGSGAASEQDPAEQSGGAMVDAAEFLSALIMLTNADVEKKVLYNFYVK